jgi:hypothetical protein
MLLQQQTIPNKALHRTAIPLRSIAAGELCRWAKIKDSLAHMLPPKPIATKGGNHAI